MGNIDWKVVVAVIIGVLIAGVVFKMFAEPAIEKYKAQHASMDGLDSADEI